MNKKKSLIITSVVCILPLIAGVIMLGKLPEMLPVQWANDGTVSNYAPRWFAVFGMPVFFLLMNAFFHYKAEKSDLADQYPPAMKLFLKWSMPVIGAVCTTMTYSGVTGINHLYTSITAFVGAVIAAFGSYFGELTESDVIGRIFEVKNNDKKAGIYSRCGMILMIFGIAAVMAVLMGYMTVSIGISAAAIIISLAYSRIA